MGTYVDTLLEKFEKIYDKQEDKQSYQSPGELLFDLGLHYLPSRTLKKALKEADVPDLLVSELVAGVTRINYGQVSVID